MTKSKFAKEIVEIIGKYDKELEAARASVFMVYITPRDDGALETEIVKGGDARLILAALLDAIRAEAERIPEEELAEIFERFNKSMENKEVLH